MIVTVDEAATKRCQEGFGPHPMSNHGGMVSSGMAYGGGTYWVQPTSPMNCIGPDCMAWTFHNGKTIDGIALGFCGKAK